MFKAMTLAAVASLGITAAAQAVMITNKTTDTVVFYDDFEDPTITPAPGVAYNASPDANPIAEVGAWHLAEEGGTGIAQVTTSTTAPDPGPFQGGRYFRMYRDGPHNSQSLYAVASSTQGTTDDLIELSFMAYIPSTQDAFARLNLVMVGDTSPSQLAATARMQILSNGAGFVQAYSTSSFTPITTNVPYLTDMWQHWVIDYVVDSGTYTFSVGGISYSGLPLVSPSTGGVAGVAMLNGNSATGGSFYLDAPEPASAGLLVVGGVTALIRRRRVSRASSHKTT